ncbi:chromosomal replication initiator protein DnaA [Selenomonas ruminantium]|uniref:Chromosomal replication initiator protein DnaA n=1 Tax=Selenomonas ruminantium TaxID=971 RepID=A0A1H0SWT7_SELRU|nr:chromosomal replication initiator protein DnaA [Selenomonas ruminantium]SDP46257.1 chromosomal replication initiator protein DnaA [Selenomonas ruminantium]
MEQTQLQAVWAQILNKMKEQELVGPSAYNWLNPVEPISLTDETLELGTQTEMAKEWIAERYLIFIEDAAKAVFGVPKKVILTVQESTVQEVEPEPVTRSGKKEKPDQGSLFPEGNAPAGHAAAPVEVPIVAPGDNSSLNPKYTFDTFVTGKSNNFAHAAAMAVADKPGKTYNPFFMYGGVGLGKTHLMHAIGNRVLKNHPEMRVLYVSSEQFTNEIIQAIQQGTSDKFRQKYRNIDVLLIDDIQFISGKTSTQEEFFHTFNTLYDAQKQVIISSDRPPREVERLEERLRSRFDWGLTTDIQAPDLETRIAILKNKAQSDHFNIPDDVMVYIASRIDSNIRELEGALTRLEAYASLTKRAVNTDLVAEALKDIFPNGKAKEVTMDIIQEIVASYFKIKIEDLHSKKRTRNIAYPRQIAMYLCREMTENSLPQIGNFFGGRDHTTVIHAYDKINQDKETDNRLSGILNELMDRIQKV